MNRKQLPSKSRDIIERYIIDNIKKVPDSALKQLYDWLHKNKAS